MSDGGVDVFGVPLVPDPEMALRALSIPPNAKTGPLHKVQFVIEYVGPRSIPAATAAELLRPEWYQALGKPNMWSMRPSDLQWQRLVPAQDGSIDSLALAWDMLSPDGTLSSASALQLLQFAERFGPNISRRAVPMPHTADVSARVHQLQEARELLDIGFALAALSDSGYDEKDLWITCARLGLDFAPGGTFDWRIPGHPYPLLSVSPIGETTAFSLGNVHQGVRHEGATVGFSVPLCVAPTQALEACFYVADRIARSLGGQAVDETGNRVSNASHNEARANMKQALGLFAQVGMTAGSPEVLHLFGA